MRTFFEIKDYTGGYSHTFQLTKINITILKGSFIGIIGPNGCGKTTLLRSITGDLKKMEGNITLNGQEISQLSFKEKARTIAVVTQDLDVPDITVKDYVQMGRLPYYKPFQFFDTKEEIEIAEKYMELTGISHLKNIYLKQLSGGERQLIAITRALVQEPELLLLDEPTSHLDITHQVQVLNLVQRMNEQFSLTVLMVIHDLNLAGEYCDELLMLNNGKIYIKGTPHEVLNYSNIEKVYQTVVVTKTNPVSGKPLVFLVSGKVLNNKNKSQ